MLISLIIPTYNRSQELKELLESLTRQVYKNFEVLIIDQNDKISIDDIVKSYSNLLQIKHIKSKKKGIAVSKNIGINQSNGELITFPDDDCEYYPETLQNAYNFSLKNASVDIFYGKIFDKKQNMNVMRNWSEKELRLNKYNFHLNYSAITCFTKRKELLFDENFGLGSKYSMGEELDYLMAALNLNYVIFYTPQVSIWHPQLTVEVMSKEKVFSYAFGYGATFKKNLTFAFGLLFISSLFFQIAQVFLYLLKMNFPMVNKRYLGLKGRVSGFIDYKKN